MDGALRNAEALGCGDRWGAGPEPLRLAPSQASSWAWWLTLEPLRFPLPQGLEKKGRQRQARGQEERLAGAGSPGGAVGAQFSQPFQSQDKNTGLQNQLLILLLGRAQLQNCHSVLSLAEQLFLGIILSAQAQVSEVHRETGSLSLAGTDRQTGIHITPELWRGQGLARWAGGCVSQQRS